MVKANQIYYNGTIITMDSRASEVEAIAIAGDTILAVGSKEQVMQYQNSDTIMTDLKGKTMLPGLIDAHGHFITAGDMYARYIDLSSPPVGVVKSIAELKEKVAQRIKAAKKGDWVMGFGYDDTLLAEGRHPEVRDLDDISPDNPIMLKHVSGHITVFNSYAFNLAGITKDVIDPVGGVFRRYEDGSLNGVCEEPASYARIQAFIPPATEEDYMNAIKVASERYTAKGVTSAQEGFGGEHFLNMLKEGHKRKVLKPRINFYPSALGESDRSYLTTTKSGTQLTEDKMLSLGAAKTLADGSIQCYTAFLSNPYHKVVYDLPGGPMWRAYPIEDHEALADRILKLHREGYQIAVHGNGDDAIQNILDAYENANRVYPRADARHIIIHCQTVREDQLDRIKRLGVVPAFFVVHTYYWGDRHRDIFLGEDRARRISPCKSAVDKGIVFTNHNDTFVTPIDPLLSVWSAVNRVTSSGKVLGEEQRVDVINALRAVTSNVAYQAFEEDIKGSLEPGKLADMVILEENPLTIDPMKIKDIKILTTIIGNEVAYGNLP